MGLSRFSFLLETSAPGMIPGANVIKLFMGVIYGFSKKARVFVPGKLFKPSLTNTLAYYDNP